MNQGIRPKVDLINLYSNRDFGSISKNNLNTTVDFNGNTIVHIMAENLDKTGFEALRNINSNLFGPDVINKRNKNNQTPIHLAMDRIHDNNNKDGYDFISYMIDTLGANPDVPDNNNRVIVSDTDKEKNRRSIYMKDMNVMYDQLNENVKESIRNLKELTKSYNPSSMINSSTVDSKIVNNASSGSKTNIDFLEKLANAYAGKQKGGYVGQRIIRGGYSDSDASNSFVARSKEEIMNSLDDSNGSNGRGRYFTANNRRIRQDDDINDTNFDAYITADVITNKKDTDGDIVEDYAYDSRYKNETNNDVNQNLLNSGNNDNSNVNSSNYSATLDQTDGNARMGDTLWYDDVIPRDERPIATGGKTKHQYMLSMAKLQKEAEQIRNSRLLLTDDNDEMRHLEQQIRSKLDVMNQKYSKMVGGDTATDSENSENTPRKEDKRKYNKGTKGNRGNRTNHRKGPRKLYKNSTNTGSSTNSNFRNDFRTEDFKLFTDDDRDDDRDNERDNRRNRSSNSRNNDNNYRYNNFEDSDEDFVRNKSSNSNNRKSYDSNSETEFDESDEMDKTDLGTNNIQRNYRKMNIWSDDDSDENDLLAQERPRDEKTDEMYKSFIKTIMDLLGVDEETARFYRTALKINIENKNPELKKRINDPLKVKEIEKVMKDKKTLQAAVENIDKEQIKKIMQEKEQEGIRRREENKNKNRDRPNRGDRSDKTDRKDQPKDVSKPKDSKPRDIPTSDSKEKKSRKTKNSTAENGYIQSDEIIFSDDF